MQTEIGITAGGLLEASLFPSLVSLWPSAVAKCHSLMRLVRPHAGPEGLARLLAEAPVSSALALHNYTGSSILYWLGGLGDAAAPSSGATSAPDGM